MRFSQMKSFLIAPLLLLVICVEGQTLISGNINSNVTWTKSNSPYIINGTTTVSTGAILKIEPGVTVTIQSPFKLKIDGSIIAIGTKKDSIIFRSDTIASIPFRNKIKLELNSNLNQFHKCVFKLKHGNVTQATPGTLILKSCKLISSDFYGHEQSVIDVDSCASTADFLSDDDFIIHEFGFARITNSKFLVHGVRPRSIYAYNSVFCNDGATLASISLDLEKSSVSAKIDTIRRCKLSAEGAHGVIFIKSRSIVVDSCIQSQIDPNRANTFLHGDLDSTSTLVFIHNTVFSKNRPVIFNQCDSNAALKLNFRENNWGTNDSVSIANRLRFVCRVNNTVIAPNFSPFTPYDSSKIAKIKLCEIDSIPSRKNLSIENIESKSIVMYPNPTEGTVRIQLESQYFEDVQISIFNKFGEECKVPPSRIGNSELEFDLSNLPHGIYFVRFKDDTGIVQTKQLILINR